MAGSIEISVAGGNFSVPVTSLREARWQNVIKQQYDYSCGSAAVATLLTYHYDRPTGEKQVFEAMFEAGDQEKIRKLGFSLLDMKSYLETQGFRADGFRVSLDRLAATGIPAIALVNIKGYRHFVVVKGIKTGEVLVGDPALGVNMYPREEFEQIWANGILFVIRDRKDIAQKRFNMARDWDLYRRAPVGWAEGMRDLAPVTVLLPSLGHNEF